MVTFAAGFDVNLMVKLVAAPVSFHQPAVVRPVAAQPPQIAATKPCPFCGEQIQPAAVILRAVANEMFPENRVSARLW